MGPLQLIELLLELELLPLQLLEGSALVGAEPLVLLLEPLDLVLHLALEAGVGLEHLFDLILILGLDALRQSALVELVPVLGGAASLLKLLERDLEFPGRLVQILLIGLLLVDEELAAPLPKRFLLVVGGLGIGEGAL